MSSNFLSPPPKVFLQEKEQSRDWEILLKWIYRTAQFISTLANEAENAANSALSQAQYAATWADPFPPNLTQALTNALTFTSDNPQVANLRDGAYSESVYSPIFFGAVGNGINDDTRFVLRAIQASGNNYLYLPDGFTFATQMVTVTTAYFTVFGGGTLKLLDGQNTDLLFMDGTPNAIGSFFSVQGVNLDGNAFGQTTGNSAGLHLRNAAYTHVNGCNIQNVRGDGVLVENFNSSTQADEVNITDNRIFFNTRHGLNFDLSGTSTQAPGDCLVFSNHINYNGLNGINGRVVFSTIFAMNNVLTNTGNGIKVTAPVRCTFLANECRNNQGSGLYIDSDPLWGDGQDNLASINQLHFNNGAPGGTANNFDCWNQINISIVGNYCGDVNFSPRSLYGLQLVSTTNARIVGNDFSGNLSGGVLNFGGTSTYNSSCNIDLGDFSSQLTTPSLVIPSGADTKVGSGTLVAGAATVSNTSVTANSKIFLQNTNASTTNVGVLCVASKTPATGFDVASTVGADISTFDYWILETT